MRRKKNRRRGGSKIEEWRVRINSEKEEGKEERGMSRGERMRLKKEKGMERKRRIGQKEIKKKGP